MTYLFDSSVLFVSKLYNENNAKTHDKITRFYQQVQYTNLDINITWLLVAFKYLAEKMSKKGEIFPVKPGCF